MAASRAAAELTVPGWSTRARPARSHAAALVCWSAPCGTSTSGSPAASAPRVVPEPAWQMAASQRGSSGASGQPALDVDVVGLGAERGRIVQVADGHHQLDVLVGQLGEQLHELLGLVEERDGAQRDVDGGPPTERRGPPGQGRVRVAGDRGTDRCRHRFGGPPVAPEAGRAGIEVGASEHAGPRVGLEPRGPPERRHPLGQRGDDLGLEHLAEPVGDRGQPALGRQQRVTPGRWAGARSGRVRPRRPAHAAPAARPGRWRRRTWRRRSASAHLRARAGWRGRPWPAIAASMAVGPATAVSKPSLAARSWRSGPVATSTS